MFTTDFVSDMLKSEIPQQAQQQINMDDVASTISLKMENMLKQRLEEFEKKMLSQVKQEEPKQEEPQQEEPKQEEPKKEE